jgi:hypothetical protein
MLAASLINRGRGFAWIVIVLLIETVTGLTGFFADYKDAFFVVLIALAASDRKPRIGVVIFGALAVSIVIWLSLLWTSVKVEYRDWVSGYTGDQVVVRPLGERIQWMSEHMFSKAIDLGATSRILLQRVGYTTFYADTLQRLDEREIPEGNNFYAKALLHILTPRVLFPDKAGLDDTAITRTLAGVHISGNTSMSVGYTAEANVDFGIPGMFVAIFLIGVMVVAIVCYFMTRPGPLYLRQGCATACVFMHFNYETNIDKALGFGVTGFLALAVMLKYGYPFVAGWLAETTTVEDGPGLRRRRHRSRAALQPPSS